MFYQVKGAFIISHQTKARVVGINHVSIEVGDIQAAVEFYGQIFAIEMGSLSDNNGSMVLGDQFIALTKGDGGPYSKPGHFGVVVDDKEKVREALKHYGIEPLPGRFLGFLDPWGNHIEIPGYENIMFSKTDGVLRGMGLTYLKKNERAKKELADKQLA